MLALRFKKNNAFGDICYIVGLQAFREEGCGEEHIWENVLNLLQKTRMRKF